MGLPELIKQEVETFELLPYQFNQILFDGAVDGIKLEREILQRRVAGFIQELWLLSKEGKLFGLTIFRGPNNEIDLSDGLVVTEVESVKIDSYQFKPKLIPSRKINVI